MFLEKTIKQKENQMITKDREITQMKAQLFNEERLIREKMKKMASVHDDKEGPYIFKSYNVYLRNILFFLVKRSISIIKTIVKAVIHLTMSFLYPSL